MTQPKAKTHLQQLGFFDEDLKKPVHDEILKWVEKNLNEIVNSIFNLQTWSERDISYAYSRVLNVVNKNEYKIDEYYKLENDESLLPNTYQTSNIFGTSSLPRSQKNDDKYINNKAEKIKTILESIEKLKKKDFEVPEREKFNISHPVWEYPVTTQNYNQKTGYQSSKYIIGYIDVKVIIKYPILYFKGIDYDNEEITDELKLVQSFESPFYDVEPTKNLLIEAKTEIKSLGELFRQLNTYREYEKGVYLVISPDDTESEYIISQGFKFYKYIAK